MLRPRGQTALEAKFLASASRIWPRPGLGLVNLASKMCYPMQNNIDCVSISWLYHCNIQYKDEVKYSNVGHKFSYVLSWHCRRVVIQKYLHVAGLGLEDLASASWYWPRPWPQNFGLGLDVLACINITDRSMWKPRGTRNWRRHPNSFLLLVILYTITDCDMYCPLKQ